MEKELVSPPATQEALQEELDHPSCDWYDDHYHAKILEGTLDARQSVIELLEGQLP